VGFNTTKIILVLLHKEIGMLVMALVAVRLAWRELNPLPRLAETLPEWQKVTAVFVHLCFYALMILLPLTGWLMSSAAFIPVSFLNLFTLPDFVPHDEALFEWLRQIHDRLGYAITVLFGLHAGAALQPEVEPAVLLVRFVLIPDPRIARQARVRRLVPSPPALQDEDLHPGFGQPASRDAAPKTAADDDDVEGSPGGHRCGSLYNPPMAEEAWLSGPVAGVPPTLQPAAHALLQARADVASIASSVTSEELWAARGAAATAGFHGLHLIGALDRLFTYARGESLSDAQKAAARAEGTPVPELDGAALAERVSAAIDRALDQLRATDPDTVLTERRVGRAGLPSTVLGCLFHGAEHTARHAGQFLTTLKMGR
jgi:cytochrome b561